MAAMAAAVGAAAAAAHSCESIVYVLIPPKTPHGALERSILKFAVPHGVLKQVELS